MFENIKSHIIKFELIHYLVVIMAVSLQVQVTLFASDDYLGLRVSLADLLLPFIGLGVVFSLVRKKTNWPNWSVPYMALWLVSLAIVMSTALLNGYIVNGYLSCWALVNKYIGLFLLLSYLSLGGWIVTNSRDVRYLLSLFMSAFSGFFVLTLFISALAFFCQYVVPFPLWISDYPWDGFMANRNAFMVVFVMSALFIVWSYSDERTMISFWVRGAFWLYLPMFFVFNESRTGWIAAIVLVLILLLKTPFTRIKSVLPLLFVGCVLTFSSYYVTTKASAYILGGVQMKYLFAVYGVQKEGGYKGDLKRYIAIEDGLELYRAYDPLIGAGLGTYKPFQIEKRGEFVEVIDFTALWLLVESGVVGLSIFAGFFIICAWWIFNRGYLRGNSPYHRAMLVFLIMFAAMSILHELMYMRMIWFAVGLALVGSKKMEKAVIS